MCSESQPGTLTGPFNYFRCIFKQRKMEKSTQKIEVPILIIWVTRNYCQLHPIIFLVRFRVMMT
jgi:hypothetical protein